jgi:23S rRNA (cytosine1962-C5)-methyltransferase
MSLAHHDAIDRALAAREPLFAALAAQDTDALRLFHGVAEGWPGLTIDRYGALVIVQSFREPMLARDFVALEDFLRNRLAPFELVYNHRGKAPHEDFERWHTPAESALADFTCRENGVRFAIRGRHRGIDPWLFLDLRPGRKRLMELARERSVLNLFAYTCGAGIAAAVAGASEVWNVDFAGSALAVGERNAALNDLDAARMRFVDEDCIAVLRQLAGLPIKGRARAREYVRFEARRFDVVFLDPPAWSSGPFGAVDVERDYESLFKPALACTTPGGFVVATNHSANVELGAWVERLSRCATKAGSSIEIVETLGPGPDFPSHDGRPPLKIAVCRVIEHAATGTLAE